MELKTKYQYSNFIYPYIIDEAKYSNYILKLIKDKKCKIKFFEKEKDYNIYSYFLPVIRNFMFNDFEFTKTKIERFNELEVQTQASILSKYNSIIFEYDIGENVQAKVEGEEGIFFGIQKIEIICFNTGICFLCIKTNLENTENFSDLLDFNYKFKNIMSDLKQYDKIKIQTDKFKNSKEFEDIIKKITVEKKENLSIDSDKLLVYSYSCIDQENWNTEEGFAGLENEFLKYANVLESAYKSNLDKNIKVDSIDKLKYSKIGVTKTSTALLTSNIETENYTKLPFKYENEYLYTYIFCLYQKMYLKKILEESKKNKKASLRKEFINFTKKIWIQEITEDDSGSKLYEMWKEELETKNLFEEAKNKFDILYKEANLEKNNKINKVILAALIVSLIMNIVNFIILFNLE